MAEPLGSWTKTGRTLALLPTRLDDGGWIWLKRYIRTQVIREWAGFEEGVGDTTYRTYTTTRKQRINKNNG